MGWLIGVEGWQWDLLGCNRTLGREPVLWGPPAHSQAVRPGAMDFPLRGSNCTCLPGLLCELELINAHKATRHLWRRAKVL